jgi:hypothetical protein
MRSKSVNHKSTIIHLCRDLSCSLSLWRLLSIERKATLAKTKIKNKTPRNIRKLKILSSKRTKFNNSTIVAMMKIATFSLTITLGDIDS